MSVLAIIFTDALDYSKTSLSFVISGKRAISVKVPINDDRFIEGTENFFVLLTAGLDFPSSVTLDPANADASIMDDDGKLNTIFSYQYSYQSITLEVIYLKHFSMQNW